MYDVPNLLNNNFSYNKSDLFCSSRTVENEELKTRGVAVKHVIQAKTLIPVLGIYVCVRVV